MIVSAKGAMNLEGTEVRLYEAGEELEASTPFMAKLINNFISAGFAEEIKVVAPKETKVVESPAASGASGEATEAKKPSKGRRKTSNS